ncbi:MAG: TIGR03936 family radical SAM-associated protein [Actinobacteria bacterium]|nr:TIGR03936 family radical SAM-associated protein [Actinomycetota bacterium]
MAEPTNEAQPVVAKVRCRYSKSGRMRFASHRDFQRSLERAVRRIGLPVAFSGGFSPRPRISYANAAPTGVASRAEYFDMGLTRDVSTDEMIEALSAALPTGFVIEAASPARGKLGERLSSSHWEWCFEGVGDGAVRNAVNQLLALNSVTVVRMTKSGQKEIDVLAPWVDHAVSASQCGDEGICAILRVVLHHTTPAVRPDDVLAVLVERTDLKPPRPVLMTRLAQGPFDETSGLPGDPLA